MIEPVEVRHFIAEEGEGLDLIVTRFRLWHTTIVSFETFEAVAIGPRGVEFQKRGSDVSPDPTTELDAAEPMFVGDLKWDGCNEIAVGPWAKHQCGLDRRDELHKLIARVLSTAASLIPAWEDGPVTGAMAVTEEVGR